MIRPSLLTVLAIVGVLAASALANTEADASPFASGASKASVLDIGTGR